MIKFIKKTVAEILSVVILFGVCPINITYAEETAMEISADDIINDSLICYTNMHCLFNKGNQIPIDDEKKTLITVGETDYADILFVTEQLNVEYKWNGKTSSIVIIDDNKEGNIECRDMDTLSDGEVDYGFFAEEHTYIPIKEMCNAMSWHFFKNSDYWVISKETAVDEVIAGKLVEEILDKGKTTIFDFDFEIEKPKLEPGLFNGASMQSFASPCDIITAEDNSYLKISAIGEGYGGLYMPPIAIEKDVKYEISYDATMSEDFKGNTFFMLIQAFKNGIFSSYINGIYVTPSTAGKWEHSSISISSSVIPEDADDIRIVMATKNTADDFSGYVKVDNVKVKSYHISDVSGTTQGITADNIGNWYVLGDTITMTPKNKVDTEKYTSVFVEIYDSDNRLVHNEAVKTVDFNNGYKWKPQKEGYYEYQFYTIDKNGLKEELNEFYTIKDPKTSETLKFDIKRISVIVAKYKTKPMEERCDRLCVSVDPKTYLNEELRKGRTKGLRGDQVEIADLIGFSKIRYHFLSPDGMEYRKAAQANPHRGEFDFSEWDGSVDDAKKLGFDLVLNVMGTPRYSSPYRSGFTSPTGKDSIYYAPVNINSWKAYMDYTVNRYKDVCNKWEIWNEPHVYGGSVFWQGITSDFAEIMKTGYNVVKKYQPDDESMVILGGIGARRYTNFYEEFVQTDAYDCFDVLAMHGWDVDPWNYNKIAKNYGKEPKPVISTELHMMLRASDSEFINNTDKEEAIRCIGEFLKDFKYGSLFTTFFAISSSHNADYIRYLNKEKIYGVGVEGGAYNSYNAGATTPRIASIAMNTFFDTMGKEYNYKDEYLLANKKQNVVRVNSDGKEQLIVWNVGGSKGIKTKLSKQITDAATEDFKVVDWENHDIDTSDMSDIIIEPEKMYFISGLDGSKLDLIESAQGDKIYNGKVLYNNTEKQKEDTGSLLTHPIENGDTEPLFNKDTFELREDVNYIDKNWKWVSETDNNEQGEFSAKYGISVDEDGMYIVAKVRDDNDNAVPSSVGEMNKKDSIQFAFDTVGDRSNNGYMECYAGLDENGVPTVYKKTAPYIGGDIISDFTQGENVIRNAHIQRTVNNGETTYLIYLTASEIYPYELNKNESLHFSILANQNNGTENIGYLEWSSGLGKEKAPNKFGDVWLDKSVAEENEVFYPPVIKTSDKPLFNLETLEYNDNINWVSEDIKYVKLIDDDPDFKAKFAASVTNEGLYIAAEVEDSDINMEAATAGDLWSKDSMQIAIDPEMKGTTAFRIEMEFGKVAGLGDVLFKEITPFVSDDKAPQGYTQSHNPVEGGIHSITADDGKIIYKLFLPATEFYQFNSVENDCMKISLLFNQNNDGKRIGYFEWGSGIGGVKDAKQYGIVMYK